MTATKLIMVVGLPGTGKSTFSRALAAAIDAQHLNSDIIRSELGLRGRYGAEDKAKVYRTLEERTGTLLRDGATVIVDATLYREDLRRPYIEIANEAERPIRWIELHTSEETIRKRVAKTRYYSEADFSVHQKIKSLYEPLKIHHLSLETDAMSPESMVEVAIKFIHHEPTTN
jgi:predicted kinase